MGLLAALCFVGLVLCNRQLRDISSYDRAVVQLAVSAITILPYFLIHNRSVELTLNTSSILTVLMLGILHTGAAYCLYFSGIDSLPVQMVAVLGYLEPVVSVLTSAFILNEPLTVTGWIGAVMVIMAAAFSELTSSKK